ncbi:MAG: T9SS type A sorting domain-containing protein [Bacteroidia bacterium]
MKFIQYSILALLLSACAFGQEVRLSYALTTTEEGTRVQVWAESYSASSVDLAALNLSLAYNEGCEAAGPATSLLLDSWTDYLASRQEVSGLALEYNEQGYSRRLQWGAADPGLPQTSVVTLAPASASSAQAPGTKTLILTQDFKGACQDLYLEHSSENPLNELGDPAMQPMAYTIEHPQRQGLETFDFAISAFPNPTTDIVTLKADGLEAGSYSLRLSDLQGRLIMQRSQTFEAGEEIRISLDLRNEAQATYLLDLVSEENPEIARAVRIVKE